MKKLILGSAVSAGVLVLVAVLLLHSEYATAYFGNNKAAHQLLVKLQSMPLPLNSRLLYETSDVGGIYWPAPYANMGESPDMMAYKIFAVDLPPEQVTKSFKEYFKFDPDHNNGFDPIDVGVFPLLQPPRYSSFPIQSMRDHVPASEQNHSFVVYLFGLANDKQSDPRFW